MTTERTDGQAGQMGVGGLDWPSAAPPPTAAADRRRPPPPPTAAADGLDWANRGGQTGLDKLDGMDWAGQIALEYKAG